MRTHRLAPEVELSYVCSAQAGHLEAFNALVQAYQDDVFRWVMHLVLDAPLAEDLTQTTFLAAFEKLPSFRQGSFRAWLLRIARNQSYDELRRRRRHPSISLDQAPDEDEDWSLLEILENKEPPPEEMMERVERARHIHACLDHLPPPYREALTLVEMHELNYAEAAEIIGIPIGTLKSRLARARLRIRQELELSIL